MGLQTSVVHWTPWLGDVDTILSRCEAAKELEEAGEFQAAREALGDLWQGIGVRPAAENWPIEIKAELLLRTGTLTGWLGSAKQVSGAQESAKDLISESAALFEKQGLIEKVAEARVDMAICYWREGALDEARVTLRSALDTLGDLESDQRLRALINTAIIEQVATRYDEALRIYRDVAPLAETSTSNSLKGKFHNSYAIVLKGLGLSQDREDYIDQALVEFAAAQFHFEQAGHKRFRARVENNEGFLFASIGRFKEAYEHLDRARALHLSVGDHGGAAGADDTRAQVLLLEGKYELAEKTARAAVRSLERGGEQSILAEALTTHGKALARLNQSDAARKTLDRAIELAQVAGDPDAGGIAALTVIEELGQELPAESLREYYWSAESTLASSQNRKVRARLGECARRLVSSTWSNATKFEAHQPRNEQPVPVMNGEVYSLETEVLRYEANLIRQALEISGGSVTRAARMLGVTHQGLAFILNGRHKDLLSIRTPVKKRRRSIIRYH
ncbi:MAG TPA: helix-turn-helix domain-containing protein [Pyrinomonadaceae bacterium]|nr:helix-turn-helix domain-containing protein [Pyrinomonadaceae bacterium]